MPMNGYPYETGANLQTVSSSALLCKKIVKIVDHHKSTLGYEILNEPQVHISDEWQKIGKYNSFITNQIRKVTDKTIVYSMNVP